MEKEVGVAFATVVSQGGVLKKREIEFALLLDSLDPYGPKYNSPKFDIVDI